VGRTGNGLPKLLGNALVVVPAKANDNVLLNEAERQLVIPVLDLICTSLMQASRQNSIMTTLSLRQAMFRGFEFSRVLYFFPLPIMCSDSEQVFETGVHANLPVFFALDRLPVSGNEQAQIPTAGTSNDATALDFPLG
jgi:hypothetical protein